MCVMQPAPATSSSVTVSPRTMDRRSRLSPLGDELEARRVWRVLSTRTKSNHWKGGMVLLISRGGCLQSISFRIRPPSTPTVVQVSLCRVVPLAYWWQRRRHMTASIGWGPGRSLSIREDARHEETYETPHAQQPASDQTGPLDGWAVPGGPGLGGLAGASPGSVGAAEWRQWQCLAEPGWLQHHRSAARGAEWASKFESTSRERAVFSGGGCQYRISSARGLLVWACGAQRQLRGCARGL